MNVLSVTGLCKSYPAFSLADISFDLKPGGITGFIGRNGAGKTTTLKSLLNFVHPDSGKVAFFGKPFAQNEFEIKSRIGFVSGGVNYYPQKKLKAITNVTRRFFTKWDDEAYRRYMKDFGLDEGKTPAALSEGMKVKYSLALALSHNASLLILDEPTSGLDPVSRDELLDVFLQLAEDKKVSILFSTHITTDLEKCADDILYIQDGKLIANEQLDTFLSKYKVVTFPKEKYSDALASRCISVKRDRKGYEGLVRTGSLPVEDVEVKDANLETIMVHLERAKDEKSAG